MGCEVLYVTQGALAGEISRAIAEAGDLIDRGAKKRSDLAFLNGTEMPSVLVEVAFVDSTADAKAYEANFDRSRGPSRPCWAVSWKISPDRRSKGRRLKYIRRPCGSKSK